MALIDKLQSLGDAVRERSGKTDKMTLEEMAVVIKEIPESVVEETTITENGTYEPNEGVDGFSKVIVEIPIPEDIPAVVEAITITENGTYTAPTGVDGYSPIVVAVPIPEPEEPVLESIVITENGEYTPASGIDGFNLVTVNVPTGGGGGDIEVEPIVLTSDCAYGCAGPIASTYLKEFGDTISTNGIYNASYLFFNSTITEVPFDINISKSLSTLSHIFYNAREMKVCPTIIGPEKDIPTSAYSGTVAMDYMFSAAERLRTIPYDFFWKIIPNKEYWNKAKEIHSANRQNMFDNCRSLRALPDVSMLGTNVGYYASLNYSALTNCHALDEVVNWPVAGSYTSNTFLYTINNCNRLANFIFETNEDGTPKTADWKSQTIDFTQNVGWTSLEENLYAYNSGITKDKKVIDDATYQALKNDKDWFTADVNYSRYNHDSAVNTINSLPDCSATGTNTIKFKGTAGALTDGGAINTLTEEEIAVATAKGWTVSFV